MKSKKAKKRKRKLQSVETGNGNPEKVMKSNPVDSTVDFIPDAMPTRSVYRNQLEIGIRSRTLVLVQGPIGSGKTSIVKEVTKSLKLPCRTVQMGEQIDSKSLFGLYHCLDVPGEFCWKSSTFTEYILERGIVLLEDLDSASADLISQIIDLCDNRKTRISSGEIIQMHDEAYIVATMRCAREERTFRSADVELLLSSISFDISLPPFTDEELRRAICILYGRVAPFARKLISVFNDVINNTSYPTNGKKLGATDLLKACARINELVDLSDSVAVLHELVDAWTVHCHRKEDLIKLSEIIATHLSLNTEQLMYHLNLRLPSISVTQTELTCGRVKLQRGRSAAMEKSKATRFGLTRDVCQLLERIAVCVDRMEPVLLVGETGVGKTAVVQLLADHVGATLRVVNLSQHSDSSDLIGGYKPVPIPYLLQPLRKDYDELFAATFDVKKNEKFLRHHDTCLSCGRYIDYTKLISETARRTLQMPSKRASAKQWAKLLVRAERCGESLKNSAVSFAYVRGAVAKAAERGEWLLVDEINLATPECLDSVVHLIEDPQSRHPNFRVFACMNPASDVGKRNLPPGVRSKFTEIFVHETTEMEQLHIIAHAYLPSTDVAKISTVLEIYETLCKALPGKYSLRTLCRALSFTAENVFGSEARSLYEALSMSFMSDLDAEAQAMVGKLIQSKLCRIPMAKVTPKLAQSHIEVEGYWIEKGSEELQDDPSYVCTASIKTNLAQLARVVCSGKFPVLLEGETSTGKTAMVLHLAKITGNSIIRLNNHEHTDLQEYIGSYVPDGDGRFVFMEGPLVKAARDGYWVILDELNLAPTDVIEAINRLLDDNRELYVSETDTVVKAHQRFRLFATQNPVSSYAGRKRLSRALLNRFVVLRFGQLPYNELAQMVVVSCGIAPSAANAMVTVFGDLRVRRSAVGVFSASDGLMTLRDLFRWGRRLAGSEQTDWRQCLAEHGFFLLGARCRNAVDVDAVKRTLEKNLKREINTERLFSVESPYLSDEFRGRQAVGNIVLTNMIRRMLVLVEQSWRFDEPVLIIGETGCGKTTVAQMLAKEKLLALNCHERTEAADFLGSLRPSGDGTFQWMDGVVVQAMKEGRPLLIDEISLASDSVLERLNPLLEQSRSLFLNDAGLSGGEVRAQSGFNVVATMNPGGDYGKKELSKALRNRFTEIWCPSDVSGNDLMSIVNRLLNTTIGPDKKSLREAITNCIVQFVLWFGTNYSHILRSTITIRDVVATTQLVSATLSRTKSPSASIYHAISATLFDSFGTLSTRISLDRDNLKKQATFELCRIMRKELDVLYDETFMLAAPMLIDEKGSDAFVVGDFHVPFGPAKRFMPKGFTLNAPTCKQNIFRLVRGFALDKPILLEGPPGCGKSSTVVALAAVTGHPLTRLNLSEQTDLADLFGCDVPILSADDTPSFAWRDGPILNAIKTGQWVLLDEMNLASQSVLEGLNACFDHRHQLFIPELNRTFDIGAGGATNTRFFACQNPCSQGANRRKLPKSFVNRFTSIYMAEMDSSDFVSVITSSFGTVLSDDTIQRMINVNNMIARHMVEDRQFAAKGSPFEFNLRDLLRWAQLTVESNGDVAFGFNLLYVWRLRTSSDRQKVRDLFRECFEFECFDSVASLSITGSYVRIGKVELECSNAVCDQNTKLLSSQMKLLEKLAVCVRMNWLTLIVGKCASGKSTAVHNLASLVGKNLHTMRLTSESDSLELLGSFEQVTDRINFALIRRRCMDLLKQYPDLMSDIECAEDILSLRLALESAILLVQEDKASELLDYDKELRRSKMRFEWINSRFVDAYLNGDWILIENVNCCSAAVLDRLNACLENNGELNLSECGIGSAVKAHKDFRVFFTMDDDYGEVSRAMRNRSVELYLPVEDCAWFNVPQDVVNIVMNSEDEDLLRIAPAVELGCRQLSCWELLKLNVLLKNMDFENALKHFKITIDETMESEESNDEVFVAYPFVNANLVDVYDKWKILVWSYVSRDDWALGLLWATLTVPLENMEAQKMVSAFKCVDKRSADEIVRTISDWKQNGNLSYDERFEGPPLLRITEPPGSYAKVDKFAVQMCALWMKFYMTKLNVEKGSAINISNLFASKKIRSDQIPSPVIGYIRDLVDALRHSSVDCFTRESVDENACLAIESMWNVILFVEISHRKMDARTACAPLHLAWHKLNDGYFRKKQRSVNLCRLASAIDKVWLIDDEALERYIDFYKRYCFFEPFRSYGEWKKYDEGIKDFLGNSTESAIVDSEATLMERDGGGDKHCSASMSVLRNVLKMVTDIFYGFAVLNNCNRKEVLLKMSSMSTNRPLGLYHLACLSDSDAELSSTAYFAQFLSSSFAADEFANLCKNIDLAWISLGNELFSSVWRSLGYEISSQKVTLAQLGNFPLERRKLSTYFWKLGVHLNSLKTIYKERISAVIDQFEHMLKIPIGNLSSSSSSLSSLMYRLEATSCALLPLSVPVRNCIDPVISDEMNRNYLNNKRKIVENALSMLQSYQRVVSGQTDLVLFSNSEHPFIKTLMKTRASLISNMQNYSNTAASFRPRYTVFPSLVLAMNSFVVTVLEQHQKFSTIDLDNLDSLSDADIQMTLAQIDSFFASVQSFYNSAMSEYNAFPDIVCPFFMFLNVLVATVSYKRLHIAQLMNLRTLNSSCNLPTEFTVDWDILLNCPDCETLYKWCLSDRTIMPKRLQAEQVAFHLLKYRNDRKLTSSGHQSGNSITKNVIRWLGDEWSKWFEANTEKEEKAYVYRKSGKRAEELDEDDAEVSGFLRFFHGFLTLFKPIF